MRTGFTFWW